MKYTIDYKIGITLALSLILSNMGFAGASLKQIFSVMPANCNQLQMGCSSLEQLSLSDNQNVHDKTPSLRQIKHGASQIANKVSSFFKQDTKAIHLLLTQKQKKSSVSPELLQEATSALNSNVIGSWLKKDFKRCLRRFQNSKSIEVFFHALAAAKGKATHQLNQVRLNSWNRIAKLYPNEKKENVLLNRVCKALDNDKQRGCQVFNYGELCKV